VFDDNYQLLTETQGYSEQTAKLVLDNLARNIKSSNQTAKITTNLVRGVFQDLTSAGTGLFHSFRIIFKAPI
jgi:hypothetical protein